MTSTPQGGLPAGLQDIADKIVCARRRVLDAIAGVEQLEADWRPAQDEWSLGEVLDHLVLAESISWVIAGSLRQGVDALPPYPSSVHQFEWDAPTPDDRWLVRVPDVAVVPSAGASIVALGAALAGQGCRTFDVLGRIATFDPRSVTVRHPLIGDMDLAQWAQFIAYHLRVHARQIQDLRRAYPRRGR